MYSGIITFIFFVLAFLQQKYVTKQNKAVKILVTDSIVVFLSCILGMFFIEKLDKGFLKKSAPGAFIGNPEF